MTAKQRAYLDSPLTLEETILPAPNMDRLDWYGYLFINFPTQWPWEKARDVLVAEIKRNGENYIDHCTVLEALDTIAERKLANLPPPEREKRFLEVVKRTNERRAKLGFKNYKGFKYRVRFIENGADPCDPLTLRWDAGKCRTVYLNYNNCRNNTNLGNAAWQFDFTPQKTEKQAGPAEVEWEF